MTTPPAPPRRRRHRRGSVERPVSGRLYRASFLVLGLPLLALAFSVTRPGALPGPQLPPNLDGGATQELAAELSTFYPDRTPGGPDSLRAANWVRDELAGTGLTVRVDAWRARVPGLGRTVLRNVSATVPGQSPKAIVVLAHRDDLGEGPGANDDATGTAALIELARSYAQASSPGTTGVRSAHTIIFLSTDAGAFGGIGAVRFANRHRAGIVAVIALSAIGGHEPPRLVIAGDTPRSPPGVLVETAAARVLGQSGTRVRRPSLVSQLLDLAFPYTLYEQGPFVARGIPAVTFTTSGDRPPPGFTDRAPALDTHNLTTIGRAAQQLVGSLDAGLGLAQGTTSYVWAGDRIVRGWAIELLLAGLLVPYFVAVVDLFALCRRRRIAVLPAARSLGNRVAFWLFAGAAFAVFGALGAWPTSPARPPNPALPSSGDWPVLALIALALVCVLGWLVARDRLVPRRVVVEEEQLAGETAALVGAGIVALLVLATNPFALLFVLPPLHAWLWLPQLRTASRPSRWALLLLGLTGPALPLLSLALRFGLGVDTPWYALQLAAVGWVPVPTVAIVLCGAACTAQLVACVGGRYAPYPTRRERRRLGPVRTLLRSSVLTRRSQIGR